MNPCIYDMKVCGSFFGFFVDVLQSLIWAVFFIFYIILDFWDFILVGDGIDVVGNSNAPILAIRGVANNYFHLFDLVVCGL